jgi:hypothetical protein
MSTPPEKSMAQALARRQVLVLNSAEAQRVECVSGSLWITQDGDCKDIVLEAGQYHETPCGGRMLAYAFEDAVLRVN